MKHPDDQLSALADYLRVARPRILLSWQDAVAQDPELTTSTTISRTQFNDHIPQVLDAFEHRLRAHDLKEKRRARDEQRENAAVHGLHRWQQGYNQREAMREWGHLHICILRELERYEGEQQQSEGSVMPVARAALVRLCAEGVCESADRYASLQQAEASARLRDLERALQQVQSLEQQRAEIWREAAHDLRGTVSVIANASALVTNRAIEDSAREQFSQVLQRNVRSLRELLNDLMDLARIEAGEERRKVSPFDVAQLLKELAESLRSVADERNLYLRTDGPASLPVEGDPVKVRRIVQNLVFNALKVTERGGVCITWQENETPGTRQWIVCVQDTGPGFDPDRAGPLEHVLKEATVASQEIEVKAGLASDTQATMQPADSLASRSEPPPAGFVAGEGIGLSIVKRLCELLDASLELQTSAGSGTTFRLIFPRQYQGATIVQS
ncbi:MAG TPA: sensor histidine kinase [Steroidobacteraceae bacterium]|nr:sensor histidine kinase [Steroidobacteraceae bacterium]